MAGMSWNGRGFANRPLSLTPQCFAHQPLDRLCREGRRAELVNRFQLGRTRDEAYPDGCDRWLHGLAVAVCAQGHGPALQSSRHHQLFAQGGGRSRQRCAGDDDHRRRLQRSPARPHARGFGTAGLARWGRSLLRTSWDGHTADLTVFQERAQALVAAFQKAPSPRDLSADATLSHGDHASNLQPLGCITRMPRTRSRR